VSGLQETSCVLRVQKVDIATVLVISEDSTECTHLARCKLGEIVDRAMLSANAGEKPVA